ITACRFVVICCRRSEHRASRTSRRQRCKDFSEENARRDSLDLVFTACERHWEKCCKLQWTGIIWSKILLAVYVWEIAHQFRSESISCLNNSRPSLIPYPNRVAD